MSNYQNIYRCTKKLVLADRMAFARFLTRQKPSSFLYSLLELVVLYILAVSSGDLQIKETHFGCMSNNFANTVL